MASPNRLYAGAAMIEITPRAGTHLAGSGMGQHRPAQSVIDPLFARAVVFATGERKLCFVGLDVTIVTEDYSAYIRREAAKRFGFDPDAVMVHAIQTHSAPGCGAFMLDPDFPLKLPPELEYLQGTETQYSEFCAKRAVEAIGKAMETLQPVHIASGSGIRADLAFNRRAVMRNGEIGMPFPSSRNHLPLGPVNIRYMEGPVDPEVGVFCARTENLRMAAMLLHYTCHPVNVFATPGSFNAVSADWPGAWGAGMRQAYGPACVPLVLNGCCGNINPWDPYDPGYVPDHMRQGTELADMACRVVRGLTFADDATLDWQVRTVPLPYRDIPAERLAEVDAMLAEHPTPKFKAEGSPEVDPAWFQAASTKSVEYNRKRHPVFPYEIQVFRVGDAAFVGLPGEPFVEGQLAIKLASPAANTFVAHCVSHYVGYLPTREAYARGGHEANFLYTYWAKLAPGSLEAVVEEATGMLNALFAAGEHDASGH